MSVHVQPSPRAVVATSKIVGCPLPPAPDSLHAGLPCHQMFPCLHYLFPEPAGQPGSLGRLAAAFFPSPRIGS